ncbi:hypothetical protein HBN50_06435 [Halobacteriovorax sp. GB3]|uniref:hypothetical protein n=1 Tax=Halobacteriovorax sp. GB3 TaxID=2719615 RepID=UPI002360EB0D|nr:hypothetical protein [Halobacteriovorax sp. GB3]MDD0852725.1 hypothetical protein [Halobacteriovorax sp. GB3]
MMNEKIETILLNKWANEQLAHFYIFKMAPGPNAREQLISFTRSFLSKTISKEKEFSEKKAIDLIDQGHPDILFINEHQEKSYTLNDQAITDFIKFHQYNHFEFNHRFCILSDAHQLSDVILNKFLKTLEEPNKKTTIIFLEHTGIKLLPTIESRALVIALRNNEKKRQFEFPTFIEQAKNDILGLRECAWHNLDDLQTLTEQIKKDKALEDQLCSLATEWLLAKSDNYKHLDDITNFIEWYDKSKTFHNPLTQRVSELVALIKRCS